MKLKTLIRKAKKANKIEFSDKEVFDHINDANKYIMGGLSDAIRTARDNEEREVEELKILMLPTPKKE